MNGTIIGNRLGLCATNLQIGGDVNATAAGCEFEKGDGAAQRVD